MSQTQRSSCRVLKQPDFLTSPEDNVATVTHCELPRKNFDATLRVARGEEDLSLQIKYGVLSLTPLLGPSLHGSVRTSPSRSRLHGVRRRVRQDISVFGVRCRLLPVQLSSRWCALQPQELYIHVTNTAAALFVRAATLLAAVESFQRMALK